MNADEYNGFWALAGDKALGDTKAVFAEFNSGIDTNVDRYGFVYSFQETDIKKNIENFKCMSIDELKSFYGIDDSKSRDWKVEWAKKDIEANDGVYVKTLYRPFDTRYTYYTGTQCGFMANPRRKVLSNMLRDNLGISFIKDNDKIDDFLVSANIIDSHLLSVKAYIAPLYCYQDTTNDDEKTHTIEKIPNFTKAFQEYCAKHKILKNKSPEQILSFIYAQLYSPIYRTKYEEYLKFGFPRINFDVPLKSFEALESIVQRLVSLHLRREIPQNSEISLSFREGVDKSKPDLCIQKLRAGERFKDGLIILNETMCIKGVSSAVYEYTIGGYKVIEKWLSARANRVCTQEEFEDLEGICKILESTIELQSQLAKFKLQRARTGV